MIVYVFFICNIVVSNIVILPVFASYNNDLDESILELESGREKGFNVFSEDGSFLFAQEDVNIGDQLIDKSYNVYEITVVDNELNVAYAKLISKINMPKVKKYSASNISNEKIDKKIGLYMTHNDESYVIGDGTESVYGNGGIYDIAKQLQSELTNLDINTTLDSTLHIPHNSTAYSRSEKTAKNLLSKNVDALFDIHRDGVSRSAYVTKFNGSEKCKVRIVIGKANPNKEQNLKLALYLMAVANETYPWLFADIYYAKGHYNQGLSNKMLLFEMGTYLVEKDLVEKSVPALADVINTTLYHTVIDEDGNISINAKETSSQTTINNALKDSEDNSSSLVIALFVTIAVIVVFGSVALIKLKAK